MACRMSVIVIGSLVLGAVDTAAADLPTYEVSGLPVTPHQLVTLGPANAEQGLSALTSTVSGMPASPHQIEVLVRGRKPPGQQMPSQLLESVQAGSAQKLR